MPDAQTIPLSVTTADPMLAAMLRLVAAQGLSIEADAIERPAPDEPERLLLSVVLAKEAATAATFDHDDAEAIDPLLAAPTDTRSATRPLGVGAGMGAGIELDLLPPDDDATFRPRHEPAPADDKRALIDTQLLIVSDLARNPRLADVAVHFLKPLAGRGYRIDGNAEAVLLRLANDLVGYQPRNLSQAASVLLDGKHERFPDRKEVFAAFGEVMKPGARADQQKAA